MKLKILKPLLISSFKGFRIGLLEAATRVSDQVQRIKMSLYIAEIQKKIDSCYEKIGKYAYPWLRSASALPFHDSEILNLHSAIRGLQTNQQSIQKQLSKLEEDDHQEQIRGLIREIYIKGGQLIELKLSLRLSFLTEKPIRALTLPPDVLIVAIIRGNDLLIPKGDSLLHLGDSIFLLGHLKAIDQIKGWVNTLT